jgi:preprotein translocase subunit SecE
MKLKNYFTSAVLELKKVTWPTKQQTTDYSFIVIAMSIGVAVFFGVLDYVFSRGLTLIIK